MASGKLLKFGVPVTKQVSQTGLAATSVRSQTGLCGIDPIQSKAPPPPPMPEKFPEHLIRPPCLPGEGEKARYPPDCQGLSGFYCPVEKAKYKYPSFSENINFVPSGQVECWWTKPVICEVKDEEEDLPIKL